LLINKKQIMAKQARLLADEFHPGRGVGDFWKLPKSIAAEERLSLGAKMLYSVLLGQGASTGTAWPKKKTLQEQLGGASMKTIYRWQNELIDAHLIRVRQKGRGLSNNYYFLRHPIISTSNPTEDGSRLYAVKDRETGQRVLKTHQECMAEYVPALEAWEAHQKIEKTPFPKPHWPMNRADAKEIKSWYVVEDKTVDTDSKITPDEQLPTPNKSTTTIPDEVLAVLPDEWRKAYETKQ
jgi:hypothetical protein